MAASFQRPIVVPGHYDPMFKVDVFLHAPLREHKESSCDLKINVMALCLQLDTLCKKEFSSHITPKVDHGKTGSTFKDKANMIYGNILQCLSKSDDFVSPETYLQQSGLGQIFPSISAFLASPDSVSMKLKKTHLDNYLFQMSHLHHILALSRQIHHDVTQDTGYKYLAHQLAVLYQAINSIPSGGKVLAPHKNNIEENFKALKNSIDNCEDYKDEQSLSDIRNWILNLTEDIIQVICSMPSCMSEEILPLARVLEH